MSTKTMISMRLRRVRRRPQSNNPEEATGSNTQAEQEDEDLEEGEEEDEADSDDSVGSIAGITMECLL
jgi:hypothetical protein